MGMPSQFEGREERAGEPRDTWFYAWLTIFAAGVAIFVLVDSTAGVAIAVFGGVGFFSLAFKRGVGDLPWTGGTPS